MSCRAQVLDSLLAEVFHRYREGLQRKPQSFSLLPPRSFDSLIFLGTLGWVPPKDRRQLRSLHIQCRKGLFAARQGRPEDALVYYKQAREHLGALDDASRLGWLLGLSTYESGMAYLDFRCGGIEQARDRLDRAMDADFELEKAGLPVMQMHRIQQGHNLARMDLRLGRREAAVRLAGMLLAYMEGRIDELPYHRGWRPGSLQAVPRSLLRAMIHQVIGETANFIVSGEAPGEEWWSMIEASRLYREPKVAIFSQVQYALRAQQYNLMNNPEGFLRNLECFFRPGIRHCHLLWYAVMVEMMRCCRELNTPHSRKVSEVILRDSAKWKGLPPFLRGCFEETPLYGPTQREPKHG